MERCSDAVLSHVAYKGSSFLQRLECHIEDVGIVGSIVGNVWKLHFCVERCKGLHVFIPYLDAACLNLLKMLQLRIEQCCIKVCH